MNIDSITRRKFISRSLIGATASVMAPLLLPTSCQVKQETFSIDSIELFRYDINIPRHFSWGTWYNRQHVFMKMTSGEHVGWAEVAASKNNPELNLKSWSLFLHDFINLNLTEAYDLIKSNQYGNGKESKYSKKQMEFLEMALLDLQGRIEKKPAIELLGMMENDPIPGLYCILDSDLEKVKKDIEMCKEQNLSDFVKFKIYGDRQLDLSIIELGRSMLGDASYILSDANRGYKEWQSIDELAEILNGLKKIGMNAIEDPSELTNEQWIELQSKVGELALVPDYAMRPAWVGLERATPGMGKIYNFHPESMGSLHHLGPLATKVKGFGGQIMIGDASLVGPACTVWQQIAIGVGAQWVEALEKADESKGYLQCVVSKATSRNEEGKYSYTPRHGFGLEIDVHQLRQLCPENLTI